MTTSKKKIQYIAYNDDTGDLTTFTNKTALNKAIDNLIKEYTSYNQDISRDLEEQVNRNVLIIEVSTQKVLEIALNIPEKITYTLEESKDTLHGIAFINRDYF